MTLSFQRKAGGVKRGRRCLAPGSVGYRLRGHHCTRLLAAGSLSLLAHAGVDHVAFAGALSLKRRLSAGRYLLSASAIDATGLRSASLTASLNALPAVRRRS